MNTTFVTPSFDESLGTRIVIRSFSFNSTGFIIWYCLIMTCFIIPLCCIGLSYLRFMYRMNNTPVDEADSTAIRARESDSWDILRIQENITIFSQRAQKGRRRYLLKAFEKNKTIFTDANIYRITENVESEPGVRDSENQEDQNMIVTIKKSNSHTEPNKEEHVQVASHCAICLENFNVGETLVWSATPNCNDVFHELCILQWLLSTHDFLCPCCRQVFVDEKEHVCTVNSLSEQESLSQSPIPEEQTNSLQSV